MKLTKRTVDSLAYDPHKEIFYWDDEVPGFGIRIKSTGVKSFIIQ